MGGGGGRRECQIIELSVIRGESSSLMLFYNFVSGICNALGQWGIVYA